MAAGSVVLGFSPPFCVFRSGMKGDCEMSMRMMQLYQRCLDLTVEREKARLTNELPVKSLYQVR